MSVSEIQTQTSFYNVQLIVKNIVAKPGEKKHIQQSIDHYVK